MKTFKYKHTLCEREREKESYNYMQIVVNLADDSHFFVPNTDLLLAIW